MTVKVIVADVDGTLIESGVKKNYPPELKKAIRESGKKGILFSMASGRDYWFMKDVWGDLTGLSEMRANEAILYEDVCIVAGDAGKYVLGGLKKNTINLVNKIEMENPKTFEGLVELPNNKFTIRTARVTEEFAAGKKTEGHIKEKLEKRYQDIATLFDNLKTNSIYFPLLENLVIRKSADAIDFVDKNAHKGVAFEKYLEILKTDGIYGHEIAVIGDAENDEEILQSVLKLGGIAGFVGTNKDLEQRLKNSNLSGQLIIPSKKGPLGTTEIINNLV